MGLANFACELLEKKENKKNTGKKIPKLILHPYYIYMCASVCMYACMHVCMYAFMERRMDDWMDVDGGREGCVHGGLVL